MRRRMLWCRLSLLLQPWWQWGELRIWMRAAKWNLLCDWGIVPWWKFLLRLRPWCLDMLFSWRSVLQCFWCQCIVLPTRFFWLYLLHFWRPTFLLSVRDELRPRRRLCVSPRISVFGSPSKFG